LIDFLLKEWLLIASGISMIVTSLYTRHVPSYSVREIEVLFILFVLFVTVNGLQRSGLISKISQSIQTGKAIPLKMVVTTFFLSMLVTNDIALLVVVPLTLLLPINRKDILVILEALAANAGSALTPFGNPQNLFIYWFYDLNPMVFVRTIAPFSFTFLIILAAATIFVRAKKELRSPVALQAVNGSAYIYGISLFLILLTVLHVLPVFTGLVVVISVLLFDRKTLHIDYSLLFTFFFFFGVAENMKIVLESEITHYGHIFMFSALISQMISNVPATLLFAKFTTNWEALLWGTNTGGFGSLFGSLANLIAYKIYVTDEKTDNAAMFTAKFIVFGYMAFFIAIVLYVFLYKDLVFL
jgi:Na+/H+ antiporter NhaD/arsenite permease-like protein